MATNFPNSVDSLTNPTTSDTLASVSHSGQHADANDAIEAIQTALLDGAPLHIDDTNERVGIGTTSPTYDLHVEGTGGFGAGTAAAAITTADTGNTAATLEFQADASAFDVTLFASGATPANAVYMNQRNNAPMVLMTNNAERVRIDSSGNVGINDSTPSYKLDVNGDINATGYVNVEGDKLGMAFLGSGGLGGGTTDFTGYFTTKWRNYRVIVDPSWNGSSVFTYMQFLDTSNNPITSGYYSAGINNGTFSRWNNQSGQLCYDSSYIGRGGAIIDILGTHADFPAFHITSTAYQTSGNTYDNRISGFLNHTQDVTGLRFYNGAPYGAVYFYGYG